MSDTKDVHNEQSGSPSQSGQSNPSNATKQPGQNHEQQPGQQTQQAPKKDVQGGEKKEEPQKTNGKALNSRNVSPWRRCKTAAIFVVGQIRKLNSSSFMISATGMFGNPIDLNGRTSNDRRSKAC